MRRYGAGGCSRGPGSDKPFLFVSWTPQVMGIMVNNFNIKACRSNRSNLMNGVFHTVLLF